MPVLRICQRKECGKEFPAKPAHVKAGKANHCSRACHYADARLPTVPRICQRPECGKPFEALQSEVRRGGGKYCSPPCRFAKRWPTGLPLKERFWSKVDKTPGQGPKGECWEWRGATNYGYGQFTYDGKTVKAHRYAWEQEYGPIPDGLEVLHSCDNPPCVRCLFLGTQLDNIHDMLRKGRNRMSLTPPQVREIRASLAAGESMRELAERFGTSRANIGNIKYGNSWKKLL